MIAATVFNELKATLKNDATLKEYIKHVHSGMRYGFDPNSLPCLMLEVRENNDIFRDMGQIKKIWLHVDVFAQVSNPANPDYCIVGDKHKHYYGVLDIENDIRAVLQSSYNLQGSADDVRFEPTEFLDFEQNNIINRVLRVPVRVLFTQTDGA